MIGFGDNGIYTLARQFGRATDLYISYKSSVVLVPAGVSVHFTNIETVPLGAKQYSIQHVTIRHNRHIVCDDGATDYWVDVTERSIIWPTMYYNLALGVIDYNMITPPDSLDDFILKSKTTIPLQVDISGMKSQITIPINQNEYDGKSSFLSLFHEFTTPIRLGLVPAMVTEIAAQVGIVGVVNVSNIIDQFDIVVTIKAAI